MIIIHWLAKIFAVIWTLFSMLWMFINISGCFSSVATDPKTHATSANDMALAAYSFMSIVGLFMWLVPVLIAVIIAHFTKPAKKVLEMES